MGRTLLVLSPDPSASGAASRAVERACAQCQPLVALVVIDPRRDGRISDLLSRDGFMAESTTGQVAECLLDQQRCSGRNAVLDIETRARQAGVDCDLRVVEGDLLDHALDVLDRGDVSLVVALRERRGFLARLFSEAPVDRLAKMAPCPVEIIEPGSD